MGIIICSMPYLPRLFRRSDAGSQSRSKLGSYMSGNRGTPARNAYARRKYAEVDEYPLTYTGEHHGIGAGAGGGGGSGDITSQEQVRLGTVRPESMKRFKHGLKRTVGAGSINIRLSSQCLAE